MTEPNLAALLQEVTELRQQLQVQQSHLNARLAALENPMLEPGPVTIPTNRRRMLRRLAGGLVAGLTLGGASLALGGGTAQARVVGNPSGVNNQIGGLIGTPDKPLPTGTPASTTTFYGLVATDGSSGDLILYNYNTAITGYSTNPDSTGVAGLTTSSDSSGVYARATGSGSWALLAAAPGANSYAGYFVGNVQVAGTLAKSGGSFKIDHPLDPANQYLYHSFVESPDMLNIYNGLVTLDNQGAATVELPGWFEALNSNYRYGLTAIGQAAPDLHIAAEVHKGQFKIAGGRPGQRVSWQLTGIRQDPWAKAHRIPVEETKNDQERGLYLHPELYGQPQEKGISARRLPRL